MAFECKRCGKCCKTYYITVLPEELKRQAEFLKISEKEFIGKYTQLYLQLFPMFDDIGKLKIPSEKIPEKFRKKIIAHKGFLAPYFLALPSIAFKRRGKACIFYDEKNKGCKIHALKPEQCGFFPLLAGTENPDFKKIYPFCEGLKLGNEKYLPDKTELHYKKISGYFDRVGEKGFERVWKHWPKKGILAYKDKLAGKISEKKFFKIIGN